MKTNKRTNPVKVFAFLAVLSFGLPPLLKADVIVLQSGAVIAGKVLQQDGNGVLMQMEYGTYRYPLAWIKDVKKEAATAPHVSNNGKVIPDWAQIVTLLADNGWAPEIKQVPATVINYGNFKNVPYISFRCATGGYEINIFGDLNQPAAVQIGAMNYLKDDAGAKSNCVNFICSVLASATDRKMVRALDWNQKDVEQNGGMTLETLLPGEMGSYGGWWVTVYDSTALANATASEAELLAITQPGATAAQSAANTTNVAPVTVTPQPATTTTQPPVTATDSGMITSSGTYSTASGWTAQELADARPATPAAYPTATGADKPADTAGMVYPRTYTRTDGTYDVRRR